MDIRYLSYLSFCHAIPKLRSYCDQKLKLSLKFSYKYWTHCKTLSKTIQSLYFSLIFIFQSLKLEFERLSIFQKFSESFTKYLIRTFIHFNWPVSTEWVERSASVNLIQFTLSCADFVSVWNENSQRLDLKNLKEFCNTARTHEDAINH